MLTSILCLHSPSLFFRFSIISSCSLIRSWIALSSISLFSCSLMLSRLLLLFLTSWWNLPRLSLKIKQTILLATKFVSSNTFAKDVRTENFEFVFWSFLLLLLTISAQQNHEICLELECKFNKTMSKAIYTDISYQFSSWVSPIFTSWHIIVNIAMISCKLKYFWNS